ncbi:MAG TPA: hypothetical protein PLN13_03455 [Bacteroidia bacterium]|nr:hypothetical protein [Bacteroidia bacterium]HRH07611.1 hypothetical protein [Bacteroidia bacterium]
MSNETQTDTKKKPSFYIFAKDAEGNSQRVGAAFRHMKGNGMNIVINDQRYSAFPPKPAEGNEAVPS